jgi:hypothetical protein
MIDELYSQFNRTVFDNKVLREREGEGERETIYFLAINSYLRT